MGFWSRLWFCRGVVLSPAVIPIALTVTWSKLTRAGVFSGCIIGAVLGMLAWMIGCWKIYGASQCVRVALRLSDFVPLNSRCGDAQAKSTSRISLSRTLPSAAASLDSSSQA